MTDTFSKTFTKQDLRGRSFYGHDLQRAVFEQCDLRGCDFRKAQLQGTAFQQVRLGILPRKLWGYTAIATLIAAITIHALGPMVFGAIGTSPQHPAWGFVVALYISLAISSLMTWPKGRLPSWCRTGVTLLSVIAMGGLLGFYYGGSLADNNPLIASLAAAGTGIMLGLLWLRFSRSGLLLACLSTTATITVYSLAFMTWSMTSAAISTGHSFVGLAWGLPTILCLWSALKGLKQIYQSLRQAADTQFQGADLTDTVFQIR